MRLPFGALTIHHGGEFLLSSTLGLMPMREEGSNGYEGIASIYVAGRGTRPLVGDAIGAGTVRAWAQAFQPGATVLELGSGPGEPGTQMLREAGLATYAVDASSAMVAAFRSFAVELGR